jgi:spore photoproduct lyase
MKIRKISLEKGADLHPMAHRILLRLQGVPIHKAEPFDEEGFAAQDKGTLRLVAHPGEFLKPCPGTKSYICCGYQILNVGANCPMDCSYCILQAYFVQPGLRVFVNLEQKLQHIARYLDSHSERIFRLGTGEFTDSLALDPYTGWSRTLPVFVRERRNTVLEFKTKTDRIEGLLRSKVRDKIIVSWSLNSVHISREEEHGAPGIRKRLEAARVCQKEGFVVGFHFDPIVQHRGWRDSYLKTLELLDAAIDPKRVIWISLGCFRYMPHLKEIIRRRHRGSHILDGEFVRGLDGKMRYFKPIRLESYGFLKQKLDEWSRDLGLYLCMESDEVWEGTFGWSPANSQGLGRYLDERTVKFFPDLTGIAPEIAR